MEKNVKFSKYLAIVALCAISSAPTLADAEQPSLVGVSLGMSYEEADRILKANGFSRSPQTFSHFTDWVRGRNAKIHEIEVFSEGVTKHVPVAVSFNYEYPNGYVSIAVTGASGEKSVRAIDYIQFFYKDTGYPSYEDAKADFMNKYAVSDESCSNQDGWLGIHISKETGKAVKLEPTRDCLVGMSFNKLGEFNLGDQDLSALDYALTLIPTNDREAPDGHVDSLTTSLYDYDDALREIHEASLEDPVEIPPSGPSLADVTLGMSYEEADKILLANGFKHQSKSDSVFSDRVRNRVADVHKIEIVTGGKGQYVPYAASFPYFKDGKSVIVTVTGSNGEKSVRGVDYSQRFSEDTGYPSYHSTKSALLKKFGFEKASCSDPDRLGFHVRKGTGEVTQQNRSLECFEGMDFNYAERSTRKFHDVHDLDYGVTFNTGNRGRAADGHIESVRVRLYDYDGTIFDVEVTSFEEMEKMTATEPKVEF